MATPPTFVAEHETAWNSATTPKAQTWTPGNGNILAGVAAQESAAVAVAISGGPSWSLLQSNTTDCYSIGSSAVGAGSSATINVTHPSGTAWFGGNITEWSNSAGIGASAKSTTSKTGLHTTQAITTLYDNSALLILGADFSAVAAAGHTWDAVNGTTPTVANGFELTGSANSQFGQYVAYIPDAGAAGVKTVGITTGTSHTMQYIVIEIRGPAPVATSLAITRRPLSGLIAR